MLAEEKEAETPEPSAPKPKRALRKVIFVPLVILLVVATTFSAGVFVGPRIGTKLHVPGYGADAEEPVGSKDDSPIGMTKTLDPVVVDLMEADGSLHHVKVGVAVELEPAVKEEEFDKYAPRARDASISYLRTLEYEKVTKPAEFDAIRAQIGERVKKALGENRARRVLFTDFVVQ